MRTKFFKIIILSICLMFAQVVFAETEEEVIIVTKVPYEARLTKKPSTENATLNPANGTHTGLSSVFTLQTNGGDDNFEYIITSYVTIDSGGRVSAYGNDGRLLFAHTTTPPDLNALVNAKSGSGQSKNIFAYPTSVVASGGRSSTFKQNYKEYGNCYQIFASSVETGDVTHTVSGTPSANTYEAGLDEAGTYQSTLVFTITSK